jgi:hypothetical protein
LGTGTHTEAVASGLAGAAEATGTEAAGTAVAGAVEQCAGDARLVLAFPSGVDPERAASEIAGAAAGVPHVGLTTKGAIGPSRIAEEGCTAIAFRGDVEVGIGVRQSASSDLRSAARQASADALAGLEGRENSILLLFLDTPSSDQADAVAGAYDVAGPTVPLAGGGAGGGSPAQIVGGEAVREAVVAVALSAPRGVGLGTAHGCRTISSPSIVTRSDGLRIVELDGRPASDVYLERLGYGGVEFSDDDFEALAVTHPLAQPELNGDARLRHVRWREDTVLVCATHLPPGAAVEFTHQTPDDIVAAARRAVAESVADLGTDPGAALIFDCAGRKGAIGGALGLESEALHSSFGAPPPIAGGFTYGEVARSRGAKGDRNHAVVVATLA